MVAQVMGRKHINMSKWEGQSRERVEDCLGLPVGVPTHQPPWAYWPGAHLTVSNMFPGLCVSSGSVANSLDR